MTPAGGSEWGVGITEHTFRERCKFRMEPFAPPGFALTCPLFCQIAKTRWGETGGDVVTCQLGFSLASSMRQDSSVSWTAPYFAQDTDTLVS
jgi:hypothetical protein